MTSRSLSLNSLHVDCCDTSLANYLRDLGTAAISLKSRQSGNNDVEGWAAQDGSHIIVRKQYSSSAGGHPRTNHIVLKTSNIAAFHLPTRIDAASGLQHAMAQHPALPGLRWILLETAHADVAVEYDPSGSIIHVETISEQASQISTTPILAFDHVACALEEGHALPVATWLMETFGFWRHGSPTEEEAGQLVMMGDGALRMVTVRHGDFYIVLAECVDAYAGQVRDFIDAHGPGVQHIALKASDIIQVARNARATGRINFAVPPTSAWENALTEATGDHDMLVMVVDRKENQILTNVIKPEALPFGSPRPAKLLSQLFTAPLSSQTQLFLEIIERKNYDGFAAANISNLFASQHVDQSILFVDEALGVDVLRQWAQTSTEQTVTITTLQCKTEEDLIAYLRHTAKYFTTIVSSFVPITSRVLDALIRAPMLVYAQGTGYNHIDLKECRVRDIGVCNNAGWCSDEVAEHAMSCITALATGTCFLKSGFPWDRKTTNKRTLRGSTVGLIGCGDIGRRVIPLVRAFGMNVQIYDPAAGYGDTSLENLLKTSDYVSLHAPLTESTYHMIDRVALASMKPGSCLINTARGGLIDEAALVEALQRGGGIRAAALDAFEVEPLPKDSKLWDMQHVLISPHVAGLTETATGNAATMLIRNLEHLARGEPMDNVLVRSSAVFPRALETNDGSPPTPDGSDAGSDVATFSFS
ncbi:hypothetical protein HDU88_004757 [Geranomyces variabilis]|nr:hypothetical protein HDU88_004757 [Geranomyces variabilis]